MRSWRQSSGIPGSFRATKSELRVGSPIFQPKRPSYPMTSCCSATRNFGQDHSQAGDQCDHHTPLGFTWIPPLKLNGRQPGRCATVISNTFPPVFRIFPTRTAISIRRTPTAAPPAIRWGEGIVQGFLELVERDLYAIWWYTRSQRTEVDLDQFDDPYIRDLRVQLAETGRRLWVLDITSDLGIPSYVALTHWVVDSARPHRIRLGRAL